MRVTQRKPILCVGIAPCLQRALTFEALEMGEVNRSAAVRLGASGKATNAARVLRALGEPCRLLSLVGGGTGRLFTTFVEEEGLPHTAVSCDASVRICETLIEQGPGRVTELVEEMAPPSADDWARLEGAVEEHARDSDWVLFPGTLPPNADMTSFRRLLDAAKRGGAQVILDTSGDALLAGLAAGPRGVKLNRQELERTLGLELPDEVRAEPALRRLTEEGLGWVGVTCGGKPAWWCDGEAALAFELPAVGVVSPIGSGDSVLAGLAAGLNRGMRAADAYRLGLACGCANAETAWPGELEPDSVERWRNKIVARPMHGP